MKALTRRQKEVYHDVRWGNVKYKVDVPEGKSGVWNIQRFKITEMNAVTYNIDLSFDQSMHGIDPREIARRHVKPGNYTRLCEGETLYMSDTPAEISDHAEPIARAQGVCFVAGLGIGMVVRAMLLNAKVRRVDVIEFSEDVIKLVGPHYQEQFGDRLRIIHGNALKYHPTCNYDVAWFDIWPTISAENIPEMRKLHKEFRNRAGWYGSWLYDNCCRMRRRDLHEARTT